MILELKNRSLPLFGDITRCVMYCTHNIYLIVLYKSTFPLYVRLNLIDHPRRQKLITHLVYTTVYTEGPKLID